MNISEGMTLLSKLLQQIRNRLQNQSCKDGGARKKARDGCIFPWYFVFVGAGGDSNISVSFFGWRGERDWDISVILFLGGGRQEYFRDCLLVVCEGLRGEGEGMEGK